MDDDDEMEVFEEGVFLGFEIDLDYEFDAARYFDFRREETPAEARAAELWFETAGSYPPSPLIVRIKKEILVENLGTLPNLKDSECAVPINAQFADGNGPEESVLYGNDKGLEHSCMLQIVSKVSGKSITKGFLSKDSTLMKPTASQLAKQNHRREMKNVCRSQKAAAVKSNRNFEDQNSYLHHVAKRQRLERGHLCKIVGADPQLDFVHKVSKKKTGPADCNTGLPRLKLTIPKEPELETARRALNFRAQRLRSSNAEPLQEGMVPTTSAFKARPLNRKILEAPSLPLAQKSTPRLPSFKEFNLRTRGRAIQHCSATSSSVGDVTEPKRSELQDSGPPKLQNDDKKMEDSRNMSSIFKARPLNKKIFTSKGDFGIFQSSNWKTTMSKEFFSTTKRDQQTPLTELFNMLSLASGEQHTTASQTRFPIRAHVAAKFL